MRQHQSIRHCPVCGIAMQGRKSRKELEHFDQFECLSCHTTISATRPKTDKPAKPREGS